MINLLFLTYNRLGMVARCFKSMAPTLTRPDVEWLILDNASTDGTAEWVWRMGQHIGSKARIFLSARNLGVSGGRHELLQHAEGDILVFLDSDVIAPTTDWLDRLIAPLQSPVTGLAGPGGHWVTTHPDGAWDWFEAVEPDYQGPVDTVSGYCQAFPRTILDRGVHMDLTYGRYWLEDTDLCMQVHALGMDVVCTGNIGLKHLYAGSGDDGSGPEKMRYCASKWAGKGFIRKEQRHDRSTD